MLESKVHGTSTKYENDSVSLLIAKSTDERDNATPRYLYFTASLRFHIIKKQCMYFSLYSFLFPFFPYCTVD